MLPAQEERFLGSPYRHMLLLITDVYFQIELLDINISQSLNHPTFQPFEDDSLFLRQLVDNLIRLRFENLKSSLENLHCFPFLNGEMDQVVHKITKDLHSLLYDYQAFDNATFQSLRKKLRVWLANAWLTQ